MVDISNEKRNERHGCRELHEPFRTREKWILGLEVVEEQEEEDDEDCVNLQRMACDGEGGSHSWMW